MLASPASELRDKNSGIPADETARHVSVVGQVLRYADTCWRPRHTQ